MPDDIAAAGETPHALKLLREDHQKIRALISQYNGTDDPDDRKGIADNLVAEIDMHTLLEREFVYPVARRLVGDERLVEEAERQNELVERLAQDLEEVPPGSGRFESLFGRLAAAFAQHVEDDEGRIFPEFEKLGGEELVSMGQKMIERREAALTELRDHGPDAPASVKETG